MSRHSDEYDEMKMHAGSSRRSGDQDEVARFLADLRALGQGEPPTPSPELAALLGGATPLRTRRRPYRVALRTALVAAALVTGLVVAAEQHSLPQPAQRVVSDVVDVLTPFEIAPGKSIPTPTPTRVAPVVEPSDETSEPGDDRNRVPGGGSDDGSTSGSDDGTRSGSNGSDDGSRSGSDDGSGGGSDDGASSAPSAGGTGERESGDGGGSDD
jgi:hypothetical protein